MKYSLGREAFQFAVAAALLGFCAQTAPAREPGADESTYDTRIYAPVKNADETIRNWPEYSRLAAGVMIEEYGEPRVVEDARLVWSDNGPWSKIVVYRDGPRNLFGRRGRDVVEESVWYDVPDDKLADLELFDNRLSSDKSTGELSSRADSEDLNYLALNLADEIIAGQRTPDEARDFYRKTVEYSKAGKSSAYMHGILFSLRVPQ